ncbi:MAG TPA: ATP-binding protein [Rhizomicrobium sp.]|jgi:signal transduction histidine kinase|nr:ATP-binding protein [Rhizomicrobium sp.]
MLAKNEPWFPHPLRRPWVFSAVLARLPLLVFAVTFLHAGAASAADTRQRGWNEFNRLVAHAQAVAMTHPEIGIQEAQRAAAIAQSQKGKPGYRQALATALWLEAETLTRTNRIPEARAAATTASRLAYDGRLSKLDGDLALTRARIAESSGDFANALKNYQRAHDIFAQLGIARSQSLALLGLGDLYEKARDFAREIRYYREAAQVYAGDPAIALAAANNLGFAYEQMGRYREAVPRFEQALNIADSLKSPILQASILDSLAVSYARLGKLVEAERAADRSLSLLRKGDEGGELRFVWGAKAEIEYRRHNLAAAAADLQEAFQGLDLKTTTPTFRDMHQVGYNVYRAEGNLPLAMAHLEAFKRLDDQGRSLAASANLALLGAQFDFQRQDLEIAHLRAAELERDIRLRKSQAEIQSVVFAGIILAVLLLLVWIAWRHALLQRHQNAIAQKNVALTETLSERDEEIQRRTQVESQLRVAMHAAQQASRAKSQFLANMSHELRTPLNAIIGFSELLFGGRLQPEKSREYAGDIAQGGRHLLGVLNSVLDMARIESGKVDLQDRVVRLSDVVEHALSMLGGRDAHEGKDVRTSGCDVLVRADEVRLRQAVINLMSNALKFTGEGGVIEIRIERVEDGVDLVVEDNGEGIPADKLPVIMEPFGQVENSYARVHGGVGLGLPIVKSLAELHGGRFTVESDYGHGTMARLHLPRERVIGSDDQNTALNGHTGLKIAPAA